MSNRVLRPAARFVGKWEGFLPNAYLDQIAQPPVWTIGFGHTGGVSPGQHVTRSTAELVLAEDLRSAARTVAEKVTAPLTLRQRMALISIVFNVGPGALTNPDGSATHLLAAVNDRRYKEAADRFLEWDHAGGVVVQGLLNRRRAERWMFLHSLHPRNPHKPKPHRKAALPA